MAEMNSGIDLYSINQEGYNNFSKWDALRINKGVEELTDWIISQEGKYFMLLCNENRYYTIFDTTEIKDKEFAMKEIRETLIMINGDIIDIDLNEQNAYEIWIRNEDNENHMYVLFNYDFGVVKL